MHMSKKRSIIYLLLISIALAFAYCLRFVFHSYTDNALMGIGMMTLRWAIQVPLTILWITSIRRRILYPSLRRMLLTVGGLLLGWQIVRIIKYDYVIIDAPAGIDDGMVLATGGCDMGIIVVTPEYSSLRNAEIVKTTLEEQGIKKISYVVNKIDLKLIEEGKAPSFDEVTKNIRNKIVGIIQRDDNIHVSTNLGVPIVSMTNTYISKSFMAMGMRIKRLLTE